MTHEQFTELIDCGFSGIFKFKIKAPPVKEAYDVTIYAADIEEEQINGDVVTLTELFADSVMGRSFQGFGKVHKVDISELTPCGISVDELKEA